MSKSPCLSPDALAAFVSGIVSARDGRHVRLCIRCKRAAAVLRRIRLAGVDRIAETVAEVEHLIGQLRGAPREHWWKMMVRRDEYRRSDVARRLLALAVDARSTDPKLAVDYAECCTTIVNFLPALEQEARDLRFDAWKLFSVVLREAARYRESANALIQAKSAAVMTSQPELARASVLLAEAFLCVEPDIWEPLQASRLMDDAERILAAHDVSRLRTVQTARAFLCFRSGDLRTARDLFATLLATTPRSQRETYLHALSNLTLTRIELGEDDADIEEAILSLIAENAALGRTEWVARAQWIHGKLMTLRHQYPAAVALLTAAMANVGDADASIRAGLDLIEALLLDNRHADAHQLALELAARTSALDEREPSRRHRLARQVFAYLREAAESQTWTADLVSDVGRYLDRIARQRPIDFVPPMSLATM